MVFVNYMMIVVKLAHAAFKAMSITSHLPGDWKSGHITPIHKKGSWKMPGNYLPENLTSVIGKAMESIIRDVIIKHMMQNHLFADEQHRFVP